MNVVRVVLIALALGIVGAGVAVKVKQDTDRKAYHAAQVAKVKACKPQALYCKR